jgi:hypothetical protein
MTLFEKLLSWHPGGHMFFPMRALRILVCLVTSASIVVAMVPAQAAVSQTGRAGCCAKMKMDAQAKDCGHHAPKSEQEKECCAACVPCVAIIPSATRPFVYPSTGEESFAALSIREHVRSHRPPVPPPRA